MGFLYWAAVFVGLLALVWLVNKAMDRATNGRRRHPDDVAGQVHDFQRARDALARDRAARNRRWYSPTTSTDNTDEATR